MKEKIMISGIVLLLIGIARGCHAVIEDIYYPGEVSAGSSVPVTVRVSSYANAMEVCNFLLEVAIVPRYTMLGTYVAGQQFTCCAGNLNFADVYWSLAGGLTGSMQVRNFTLYVIAPTKGFCDRCAGMYGNPNPPCSVAPDLYYIGSGEYVLGATITNGCYYDLAEEGVPHRIYYRSLRQIFVYGEEVKKEGVCGDGICSYPESWYNCFQDCGSLNPLILLPLISIFGLFILIGLKRVSKK